MQKQLSGIRGRLPSGAVAALVCLGVFSACSARYVKAVPGPLAGSPPDTSITRHVLVVSIDGLRPDAIGVFRAPTLQRLIREGSYTLSATTIMPSKTLPSHTSMLTGEPPERHKVLWNTVATAQAESVDLPNIFSVARAHGYRTAAFFSKAKFQPLQRPGTLDYSQAPGGWFGRWSSERTVADVATYVATAAPNLLFVHLTDPDAAGHRDGWMSAEYGSAVVAADAALSRLLELADKTYGRHKYGVIVTADHGGHGYNHGSSDPQDITIPWIAWGQGVKQGTITSTVRIMQTASTVLSLLGLSASITWEGTPVTEVFESPIAIAAKRPGHTPSIYTDSFFRKSMKKEHR